MLVYNLRFFDDFAEDDFALAGTDAQMDITLEAGKLSDVHGSLEHQLRKLGMPTKLENGVLKRCIFSNILNFCRRN